MKSLRAVRRRATSADCPFCPRSTMSTMSIMSTDAATGWSDGRDSPGRMALPSAADGADDRLVAQTPTSDTDLDEAGSGLPTGRAIEVFADVRCPFAHVGLRRLVERRRALGRDDVRLVVRAWPM